MNNVEAIGQPVSVWLFLNDSSIVKPIAGGVD